MSRTITMRGVAFVAIAVHMQLGGITEQVLGWERPPYTIAWRMYATPGRNVCEATWYRADPEALVQLNRLAILGYDDPRKAPMNVRLLNGEDEVRSAARVLCGKLRAVDVRAQARCGGRGGRWKNVITTEEELCNQPAPPPTPPRRRKR